MHQGVGADRSFEFAVFERKVCEIRRTMITIDLMYGRGP
jgi:hypothetical protein